MQLNTHELAKYSYELVQIFMKPCKFVQIQVFSWPDNLLQFILMSSDTERIVMMATTIQLTKDEKNTFLPLVNNFLKV